MKKVLILGGAGFIGFNIANYLSSNKEYQITIADNFSRGKNDAYLEELLSKDNVFLIEGDFTKLKHSLYWMISMIIVYVSFGSWC